MYNSGTYCNSRMLLGMAEQGDAPKALAKIDKRGVPVRSILASAAVTLIAVLLNYLIPQNALELLMSLVVATLVINWAMISYSHFKFRQHMNKTKQTPLFKALWYPYGNYICLAFVLFILGVMLLIPGIQIIGVRDSGVARVHVGLLRHQEQAPCTAARCRQQCEVTLRRNNKPGQCAGFVVFRIHTKPVGASRCDGWFDITVARQIAAFASRPPPQVRSSSLFAVS